MKLRGIFAWGLAVLVACGGDDGPAYPDADAFCAAKAAAECKVAAGPCAVTTGACAATRKTTCLAAAAAATTEGRSYTASLAEACLEKTKAVYADRVPDPTKEAAYDDACARVFVGKKQLSEACTTTYACAANLVCDVAKGFCGTLVTKKNNEPCNNPGELCATGLYCQDRGTSSFCSAKAKLGDQCSAAIPCADELRCAGTCLALLANGEPCDASSECATGLCNSAKKCAARQFPTATGTCADFGGSD